MSRPEPSYFGHNCTVFTLLERKLCFFDMYSMSFLDSFNSLKIHICVFFYISLDGIVDHYKREEIVNGYRLGEPVPPKVNTSFLRESIPLVFIIREKRLSMVTG